MFTKSCKNIRLNDSNILVADCQTINGSYRFSSLDLDTLLGNIDGDFVWGKQGFSQSARRVTLKGSILAADLRDMTGAWVPATVELSAFIKNNDGVLEGDNIPGTTGGSSYSSLDSHGSGETTVGITSGTTVGTTSGTTAGTTSRTIVGTISGTTAGTTSKTIAGTISGTTVETTSRTTVGTISGTTVGTTSRTTAGITTTGDVQTREQTSKKHTTSLPFTNFRLENSILRVDCLLHNDWLISEWYKPTYAPCSIDLDSYVGNVDGQLTAGFAAFSKTSRIVHLEDTYLVAECQTKSGKWVTSRLELGEGLRLHYETLAKAARTGEVAVIGHELPPILRRNPSWLGLLCAALLGVLKRIVRLIW